MEDTPQGKPPPFRGRVKSGQKLSAHLIRFDVPVAKDEEVKVRIELDSNIRKFAICDFRFAI
jgi:hypothetical protein